MCYLCQTVGTNGSSGLRLTWLCRRMGQPRPLSVGRKLQLLNPGPQGDATAMFFLAAELGMKRGWLLDGHSQILQLWRRAHVCLYTCNSWVGQAGVTQLDLLRQGVAPSAAILSSGCAASSRDLVSCSRVCVCASWADPLRHLVCTFLYAKLHVGFAAAGV